MAISFDVIDKFATTIIDFWTLRPRNFLESVKNNKSRYLTPPQFFLACLSLISALYIISFSFHKDLSEETLKRFPFLKLKSDPTILAGRQIAFLIMFLVAYSLYVRAASWWPIKGKASFKDIMYYQFYALAVSLPFLVLEVIITPLILEYIDVSQSPNSIYLLFVLPIIGIVIGTVLGFIYIVPGHAKLNGVSTGNMLIGIWLFGMVFELAIGAIIFTCYIIYIIFSSI